jgi:HTH-type transcriptional regulator, competence development regulator
LTIFVKSKIFNLKTTGELIRELREKSGLLLRQVAAEIEIDQALLSKIERGERMPTKDQIVRLAKFYNVDMDETLITFFSDKLVYEVQDEDVALKAMQVAEKKINYLNRNKNGR